MTDLGRELQLIHALRLPGGERVTVRPARPEDAGILQAYIRGLSPGSRYNRFFGPLRELPPAELDRLTHMDHPGRLALIAETSVAGVATMIGEARYAALLDSLTCEFAVSVADAWRGKGLGALLLQDLDCRARSLGVRWLVGDVLRSNEAMQALARKTGFGMAARSDDAKLVRVVKDISAPEAGLPCNELTASSLPMAA